MPFSFCSLCPKIFINKFLFSDYKRSLFSLSLFVWNGPSGFIYVTLSWTYSINDVYHDIQFTYYIATSISWYISHYLFIST